MEREPLLLALLESVDKRYRELRQGKSPRDEWARHLVTLGRTVTVSTRTGARIGVAEDVDTDGALMLRLVDGSLERVVAGDVTPGVNANCLRAGWG
jgi:BirA family biotin operon repressor/biotin-[acetyl-CoA-carboxylase] ligase